MYFIKVFLISLMLVSSSFGMSLHNQLMQAIKNNDKNQVQRLTAQGVDINTRNDYGYTALHEAAKVGNSGIMKILLAAGADVNACDDEESNAPLHIAAIEDRVDIAQMLINAGANVNLNEIDTPLHFAAEYNSVATAHLLIKRGADVNAQDAESMTPLHRAVEGHGGSTIIQMLIEAGAAINARDQDGKTPLHHALYEHKVDIVRLLIDLGADVHVRDSDGNTLLHDAIAWNALINKNAHKEYNALAKVLINSGVDVNACNLSGRTPLFMAVLDSIPNAFSVLGQDTNNIDTINIFLVPDFVVCDMTNFIRILIEFGADINRVDNQGVSPLNLALVCRSAPITDILTKNRVIPNDLLETGLKLYSADLVKLALMRGALPKPEYLRELKRLSHNSSIAEVKNAYALLGRILHAYFKILGDTCLKHGGISKQGLGDILPNEIKVKIAHYVAQNVR